MENKFNIDDVNAWLKEEYGMSYDELSKEFNKAVDLLSESLKQKKEMRDKIDKANKILSNILVVKQGEIFRPVKNTSSQEVYCAICLLNELLETPYRINYNLLKEDK